MQGSDNRVQYKTKKKKCPAMVRLHRTQDFGWYVSVHRAEHNHALAESYIVRNYVGIHIERSTSQLRT